MEAEAGGMLPQPKTARDFRILARSLQRAGSPAHMLTVAPTGPFQGPSRRETDTKGSGALPR